MRLLKIGSSPSCDVVLQSEYVSGLHAEMTLLDNGEIVIVDKNSTNGTYVGSKKITPNQEITVRRGDYVRFGNEDLVWARIPVAEKLDKYKQVINIGSNYRNDVVINSEVVSRFHASLRVDKKNKVFIVDNHSKNGTQVNGVKIQSGKPCQIKRGDNVVCGTEDITESIAQYLPSAFPMWAKLVCAVAGVAAIVAIIFGLSTIIKTDQPKDPRNAVVYVRASFHYNVTLEDNPFKDTQYANLLEKSTDGIPYYATAFFIDEKGCMATNRHVAMPWDEAYRDDNITEQLLQEYQKFLLSQLQVSDWQFVLNPAYAIMNLQKTQLGNAILNSANSLSEAIALVSRLQKSKVVISGEIDDITVGYAGQYYTNEDEFQRCNVLASADSQDEDVAILQLNTKKLPNDAEYFSLQSIPDKPLEPQKDELYVIGYPLGLFVGQDTKTKSLEPNIKLTRCSKVPGKFNFEFQESSIGGSSGSPVYTKKGHKLVGILSSGLKNQTISLAVQAKYLKKLYEDEIGPIK